jgi:hypothetical protein
MSRFKVLSLESIEEVEDILNNPQSYFDFKIDGVTYDKIVSYQLDGYNRLLILEIDRKINWDYKGD